jgi:putative aldouronate transport system substrate-binding protein
LLADFERFLYTVKEKEKDIKPFVINGVKADKLPEVMSFADIPQQDILDTMVYERDRLLKAS